MPSKYIDPLTQAIRKKYLNYEAATCDECGKSTLICRRCSSEMGIYDFPDIYHAGYCLTCDIWSEEYCRTRIGE